MSKSNLKQEDKFKHLYLGKDIDADEIITTLQIYLVTLFTDVIINFILNTETCDTQINILVKTTTLQNSKINYIFRFLAIFGDKYGAESQSLYVRPLK